MKITIILIFWFCASLVLYTYLGYGILIFILVKIKELFSKTVSNVDSLGEDVPEVTLFITAYNEEDIVYEKMQNTMMLDYPKDKLKVLWVTDGSSDSTNEKLEAYDNITVLFDPVRRGKTAAVNRGMQFVDTPYVVFTDANSIINPKAITHMISLFQDERIGCVSGEKRVLMDDSDNISSKGESMYWKYESLLKSLDSRFYTTVGAAGELYAIRSELYKFIPEDTLLDDFILSMQIAQRGYRIAYTKDAYAVEKGTINIKEEEKRKKRITAGGWQAIFRLSALLNIFRYGRLSFQYISHRVLRWSIAPFALFALLPVSLILSMLDVALSPFYGVVFICQLLFYLLAFVGYLNREKDEKKKLFYIPYYFVFMNINVFKGLRYLYKNRGNAVWEKSVRS